MARRLASQAAQQWMGLTLGLLALTVALGGTVFAHGGDAAQVHACVQTGDLIRPNAMIVGAGDACPDGWTARDWSIEGPAGPMGPRGDAGAAGAAGADGGAGAQGPQGPQGEAAPSAGGAESNVPYSKFKRQGPSIASQLLPAGSKQYSRKSPKDTSFLKGVQALCPHDRPDLLSGGYDLDGIEPADVVLAMNQAGLFGWSGPGYEGWQTIAKRKGGAPATAWALKVTVVCKKK